MAAQILCIGDSMTYGGGSTLGGWPDLLKLELHKQMYKEGGDGSTHRVYNLAIPGDTTEDFNKHISAEIEARKKPGRKTIIVVSIGTAESKAKNDPEEYIATTEGYQQRLTTLLKSFRELADNVIAFGFMPVDEKRMPKIENDGTKFYFTNQRIRKFEDIFKTAAEQTSIHFMPLFDLALYENWVEQYLYADGIHPNTKGHQWLFDQIWAVLKDKL